MDCSIKIAGEAGQGVQTIGAAIAKVFSRAGLHVFAHQDLESRIRGGHNFYQVRAAGHPVTCPREKIDLLVALNRESIDLHAAELGDGGAVLYDPASAGGAIEKPGYHPVAWGGLALSAGGSKVMASAVTMGAICGLTGAALETLNGVLNDQLGKKGGESLAGNLRAAAAGFEAVKPFAKAPLPAAGGRPKLLASGNDALSLGAVAAGCRFYSSYPMTPATSILAWLSEHAVEYGLVVEQAEDEIAALELALGASYGGVRAMAGTSGGGFSLMMEGISLAAVSETPVVIALAQRAGPATGFPTRTEQAELLYTLHAGHGEFARVVFAPGTPEECFQLTRKAFDLAEKYQVPAFVLTDHHLADLLMTHDDVDLAKVPYTDHRLRGEDFAKLAAYRRYAFTGTGVSPLGVPGDGPHAVVFDSHEHDEDGHITEDGPTRIRMTDKRLYRKLDGLRAEIAPPLVFGAPDPEVVVVGWGSTFGAIREAVEALGAKHRIAGMHFSEIFPLPGGGWLDTLKKARKTVCVEQNATGQFARFIRAETGFDFHHRVLRYDGRPFHLESLIGEIDAVAR